MTVIGLTGGLVATSSPAWASTPSVDPQVILDAKTSPAVELVKTDTTATATEARPLFKFDAFAATVTAVQNDQNNGSIASDLQSMVNEVVKRVDDNPNAYWQPDTTGQPYSVPVRVTSLGSGFFVDGDGDFVTAAHVVNADPTEVKKLFTQDALNQIIDSAQKDFGAQWVQAGIGNYFTADEFARILDSLNKYVTAQLQIGPSARSVAVELGVSVSGAGKGHKAQPARVLSATDVYPQGSDIAVLKLEGLANMPTLRLGSDSDVSAGSTLLSNGFPYSQVFESGLSAESTVQSVMARGTLAAKKSAPSGAPVFSTQLDASPGASGEAVMDVAGDVVGILVAGTSETQTLVIPVSQIQEQLSQLNIHPTMSLTTRLYNRALDYFYKSEYRAALPDFVKVQQLDSGHPYVQQFITDSTQAISQGKDHTPHGPPMIVKAAIAGAGLLVLLMALMLLFLSKRRRKAKAKATRPDPSLSGGAPDRPIGDLDIAPSDPLPAPTNGNGSPPAQVPAVAPPSGAQAYAGSWSATPPIQGEMAVAAAGEFIAMASPAPMIPPEPSLPAATTPVTPASVLPPAVPRPAVEEVPPVKAAAPPASVPPRTPPSVVGHPGGPAKDNGSDDTASSIDLGIPGIQDAKMIGRGAFGEVYRATQSAYRRTVAVKVLTLAVADEDSLRAFERECQALGTLSGHPNIATLHAAGMSASKRPYMIMDYVSGGSLGDALADRKPKPWSEAVDIGVKLAGALATAHAAGVLHRDVKPENVLVSAYGEPQLADFGVARLQGGTRTASGTITGSLAHAAPEVLSGVSATEASDIWSLASTIATLMAAAPPFYRHGDQSLHPLITRILTAAPTDLRPLGVPPEICEVLEAGMTKDSWERPRSAFAFGKALQKAQRSLGLQPTAMAAPHQLEATSNPVAAAPEPGEARPIPEAATRRRAPSPTPVPAAVGAEGNGAEDNPPRGFARWRPSS